MEPISWADGAVLQAIETSGDEAWLEEAGH